MDSEASIIMTQWVSNHLISLFLLVLFLLFELEAIMLVPKSCDEAFRIIESSIAIAATIWPQEFQSRRCEIVEKLFSVSNGNTAIDRMAQKRFPAYMEEHNGCLDKATGTRDVTDAVESCGEKQGSNEEVAKQTEDSCGGNQGCNEEVAKQPEDGKKERHIIRIKRSLYKKGQESETQNAKVTADDAKMQEPRMQSCAVTGESKDVKMQSNAATDLQQREDQKLKPALYEDDFRKKFEAAKRKMQEGWYQQFEDAKKRIRLIVPKDIPKPNKYSSQVRRPKISYRH